MSGLRHLAIAAILVCATQASAENSRRLFFDAQVFTADPAQPYADAVLIDGDRIVAVGTQTRLRTLPGPPPETIDLHGKFLMPGMIDAHAHPIDGGRTLAGPAFSDIGAPLERLEHFVEATAAAHQDGRPVLTIYNVDTGYWTEAATLDARLSHGQLSEQPVVLLGSDGHTAWANAAARQRAGITAAFVAALPPGERGFYGTGRDGAPNGFVVDAGLTRMIHAMPPASPAKLLEAGRAALHAMNALGITGWLDAAASGVVGGGIPASLDEPGYFPTYLALSRQGELSAHVAAYPVIFPDGGFAQLDVAKSFHDRFERAPDLLVPGIKVFADGVVEFPSQTAVLTQPYLNGRDPKLLFTPSKFAALVTEADRRGMAVHVHAIGDRAVKAALDGFAAARHANPMSDLPHIITHAQFVDAEDVPRFAQLHVIAALQLLWALADASAIDVVKPYVQDSIFRTMYPARALLDAGTIIAGASDWPVSSANPFEAIYEAETRIGPEGVLDATQRMPRLAMFYAYTRNAARAIGQQDRAGMLVPGRQADMVLVDRDVLTVPASDMRDAKVLWTMFGGRVVYRSGSGG